LELAFGQVVGLGLEISVAVPRRTLKAVLDDDPVVDCPLLLFIQFEAVHQAAEHPHLGDVYTLRPHDDVQIDALLMV
jgi:hypothetical protein